MLGNRAMLGDITVRKNKIKTVLFYLYNHVPQKHDSTECRCDACNRLLILIDVWAIYFKISFIFSLIFNLCLNCLKYLQGKFLPDGSFSFALSVLFWLKNIETWNVLGCEKVSANFFPCAVFYMKKKFYIELEISGCLKSWSWPIFRNIWRSSLNKQNLALL